MARAFGLGSITGIDQVVENAGNIPDPTDESIGGTRLPLGRIRCWSTRCKSLVLWPRLAMAVHSYRPQVIEKITDPDGKASFTFKPEVAGQAAGKT